jgi:two-component sensor histidine kinase
MERDLRQRLVALSAAHDLVRTDFNAPRSAARLGDLLGVLLKPYTQDAIDANRVRIAAPDLLVGESAATTLALIIHELATNSIKYGALSSATGALDISCDEQSGDLALVWKETGGPPIVVTPQRTGFGSKLVTQSVSSQLGGSIDYQWPSDGVIITLRARTSRLGA